jgi:hypothetical protein
MSKTLNNSVTEHHEKGFTLAEKTLANLLTKKGRRLGYEDLRGEIEKFPDTTSLQVTIADLWLNLSKRESLYRRKVEPPPSPFSKVGKELVGVKSEIRDWDRVWLELEWLRAGQRIHARSGSQNSRAMAAVLGQQIAALLSSKKIVGFVDATSPAALTQAIQHPERLRVKLVTLDEAMESTWLIPSDQLDLIDCYLEVLQDWRSEAAERPSEE